MKRCKSKKVKNMKLRYFIPLFAAVMTLLTGCKSEEDPIYLDNFTTSTSYVALDKNGGSTQVGVKATDSWAFDTASIPSWLTVSPTSGSAGESTISFSADANPWSSCAGKTQHEPQPCPATVQTHSGDQGPSRDGLDPVSCSGPVGGSCPDLLLLLL